MKTAGRENPMVSHPSSDCPERDRLPSQRGAILERVLRSERLAQRPRILGYAQWDEFMKGEQHGLSVFFRVDEDVFHTYSTYARGTENLTNTYALLDTTPYGRQQDFEDSPPGWPQKPTYK
jgi:predicted dithiol-disulfide oxidoreductase (DUF899 family)